MLISVCVGLVAILVSSNASLLGQESGLLSLVVPGLVAISATKYSFSKVSFGALLVTMLTYFCVIILAAIIPYGTLTWLTVGLGSYVELGITNPFIVFPISILTSIALYYKFGIRSGGYLVAPFLAAAALSSPLQGLLLAVSTLGCYYAVKLMLKHSLMIGLERFVFTLFCAYIAVSLIDLLAVAVHIPGYRPAPIILIIAIAVLCNDLTLQAAKPTLVKGIAPSSLSALIVKAFV